MVCVISIIYSACDIWGFAKLPVPQRRKLKSPCPEYKMQSKAYKLASLAKFELLVKFGGLDQGAAGHKQLGFIEGAGKRGRILLVEKFTTLGKSVFWSCVYHFQMTALYTLIAFKYIAGYIAIQHLFSLLSDIY